MASTGLLQHFLDSTPQPRSGVWSSPEGGALRVSDQHLELNHAAALARIDASDLVAVQLSCSTRGKQHLLHVEFRATSGRRIRLMSVTQPALLAGLPVQSKPGAVLPLKAAQTAIEAALAMGAELSPSEPVKDVEEDLEAQALLQIQAHLGVGASVAHVLLEHGLEPDTLSILPLVPLCSVAWVDGGLSPPERKAVLKQARLLGVNPDSASERLLKRILKEAPQEAFVTACLAALRSMYDALGYDESRQAKEDVVRWMEVVAKASGGMLGGLAERISGSERAAIEAIQKMMG